ncbi:hypothetical protein AMAG_00126 [Allomyces macrogynus ATCC 38327]|uniref:Phosphatidylglycerol/phosphatidylinositol transfer protein n=1 Tax=Allomyces macrogynus (strain ATCC 38327) TaxID=578462 RepID=A0A0L0RV09_ALLM3|nr:hypothetical protein, variant [Allomyces macrogynus ATCC 38327]KNE54124.1 hypothetical protein AMAG_00126 [Allomyces macrogynus ATCC 38327]|eukprot:KNE54123.1 hypothetical protein, variant [Allomyces macrogynus ATCC 38327]
MSLNSAPLLAITAAALALVLVASVPATHASPAPSLSDAFTNFDQHSFIQGLAPAHSDGPITIHSVGPCRKNSASDLLDLEDLKLIPDPPRRGQKFVVEAKGTLKSTLEQGSTVHVVVKLGKFIQLLKQDMDMCKEIGQVGMECPVQPGPIVIRSEFDLPREIPPGTFFITADVTDQEGAQVTCIQAQLTFH